MARKKLTIVGNWKMNPDSLDDAKALFSSLSRKASKAENVSVVIAPPYPFLAALAAKESAIAVSAQDVSTEEKGAFTGSVSALEIKSVRASYAIIGHSERRKAGDTDESISKKVKRALDAGLRVILCVGESERDTEARYLRVIRDQILTAISLVDEKKAKQVIIAYEPVWAIGKDYNSALGPREIHETSLYIKKIAAEAFGKSAGLKMPVLYGGSVNYENAKGILKDGSIDGLLVGRQSLDVEAFGNIIDYADSL